MKGHTFKEIDKIVDDLHSKYHKNAPDEKGKKTYKLPIDLDIVCQDMGIVVQKSSKITAHATNMYSMSFPAKKVIVLTDYDRDGEIISEASQRFSIAHHIGHFLLHQDNPTADHFYKYGQIEFKTYLSWKYKQDIAPAISEYYKRIEVEQIQADYFASCLLSPRSAFDEISTQMANKGKSSDEIIEYLAHVFFISKRSARRRLEHIITETKLEDQEW